MKVKPRPLATRLELLDQGYAAHEEYVPALIRSMAEMPISNYLAGFPDDLKRLRSLLGFTGDVPYQKVAAMVDGCYHQSDRFDAGREASRILARPLVVWNRKYLDWRDKHESETN